MPGGSRSVRSFCRTMQRNFMLPTRNPTDSTWDPPLLSRQARRVRLLEWGQVDVVLDIGANTGQYARDLRNAGYTGRIVSFEPLTEPFTILRDHTDSDRQWECHQIALGETEGLATMHVSGDSISSSLLPIASSHVDLEPEAGYIRDEPVAMTRLESLWDGVVRPGERPYLKLDVQAYELHVLRGAGRALARTSFVEAELSLVPMYEGGPLFHDVASFLEDRGYEMISLEGVCDDPRTGVMRQVDGIFCSERTRRALMR
jgi:FkbM family methyltransferase